MDALKLAIEDARDRYAALNPLSNAAEKKALKYLPGGNTRSVLHFEPFPLTMVSGEGAELTDLDGHRYVDFVGEYSAGLFGHSDPRIKAAINEALDAGIAMGAPMKYERTLAALLCERYPALEQVRFCNSGTEANLMALTTACAVTGRDKILAFRDAYHGGVIKFPGGRCELNVPYDFVLVGYNDIEGAAAIIRGLDDELAAVIVEPILGAGGNIPGNREFLDMLRRCTEEVGALLLQTRPRNGRQVYRGRIADRCLWRSRRSHGAVRSEARSRLEPRRHIQQQCMLNGRRLRCDERGVSRKKGCRVPGMV
jgi:glutamate-1-semialdehyde 2,1-aminomutase